MIENSFEPLLDLIADKVATKVAALQARDRKRLYGLDDAAEYLSLSYAQVYRLVASGKLKSLREGKRILIDRDALDRWIAVQANQG